MLASRYLARWQCVLFLNVRAGKPEYFGLYPIERCWRAFPVSSLNTIEAIQGQCHRFLCKPGGVRVLLRE